MPHLGMVWGVLGLEWGAVTRADWLVVAAQSGSSGWFFFFTKRPQGLLMDPQPQPCEPPALWTVPLCMQMFKGVRGRWAVSLLWVSLCSEQLLGWLQLREKPIATHPSVFHPGNGPWLCAGEPAPVAGDPQGSLTHPGAVSCGPASSCFTIPRQQQNGSPSPPGPGGVLGCSWRGGKKKKKPNIPLLCFGG